MDELLKSQPEESDATDLPEGMEESDATDLPKGIEQPDAEDLPEGMEESDATEQPERMEREAVTERVEKETVTKRTERVEKEVVTERTERAEKEAVTEQPERAEETPDAGTPEAEAIRPDATEPEKEAPPTKAEKLTKKAKRAERSVKEYQFAVLRVLLLLLVLWVLFFKFIGLMRMPSDEMYPRIDAGDMILYYRLDTDVRAQDIIVLRKSAPDGGEPRIYVLRVVAASGDTVEISDSDRLKINGSTMAESNIFYPTPRYEGFVEYPLTLGEDECFVLADSRNGGSDSRYFGPVRRDEILGTVITILRRNNL